MSHGAVAEVGHRWAMVRDTSSEGSVERRDSAVHCEAGSLRRRSRKRPKQS